MITSVVNNDLGDLLKAAIKAKVDARLKDRIDKITPPVPTPTPPSPTPVPVPNPTPQPTPTPVPTPTPSPTPQPNPAPQPDPLPKFKRPFNESAKQTLSEKGTPGPDVYKASVAVSTSTAKITDPIAFALNQELFAAATDSHFQGSEELSAQLAAIVGKEAYAGKNIKSSASVTEQQDIKVDNVKLSIRAKYKFTFSNLAKVPIKHTGNLVVMLNGKKVNPETLPDNLKALLPEGILA